MAQKYKLTIILFLMSILIGIVTAKVQGIFQTSQNSGPQSVFLFNKYFSGTLHNNASNRKRQGSGFNPLVLKFFPNQNVFRDDAVGLNFEHIMNGSAKDANICMFTPRKDSCFLFQVSDSSALIIHKAKESSWNMDSEMKYTLTGKNYIDLDFKVTLREDKFPLGYVGFMWASYINNAVDRRLYFWGMEKNSKTWVAFGENTKTGFETGTVAFFNTDSLVYEKDTKTLNLIEDKNKKFILPFYYGLVNGCRGECKNDTMVYIMMFDQTGPIRFAMWNFFRTGDGKADTHSPAWDWQYVIRSPQLNKEYGYSARIVYKPYAGRKDVLKEYEAWAER